jgi:hypothetical protein
MTRKKRVALGCLGALVLLAGALLFLARGLLFPKRWDVVPITSGEHYQAEPELARAFALPVAAAYGRDIVFQSNGSVCGPTSLANVFRSLHAGPESVDGVLDGTGKCWSGVCMGGLTLDELADVARHASKRTVTVLRDLTLDAFRGHLARVNDPSRRYVLNFDRGPLFGTSGGHHSPLGAYLADKDLVLVLDVNRKYRPWLVETTRLFAAMNTVDGSSGKKRGLLLIE